ncbi:MAG: hypothetical protein CFE47_18700 [Pseudomonas sp. PGPPP1]|uniref:histidine phosphatase family protein n=1 Tax=Pseudomonas cremoris TaxID=2724178 RepID=UPI000BD00039|nr:MAG: hypothetical protein CFE47_18700 [Pseudomonas sp. PGPPP1]
MKHVRLIRHGESAANAGEPSLDHASIPLTVRGVEQAHQVACSFDHAPGLVVASPFSRAQSTAMATVARYPAIRLETWPIHEFTYLEPARCVNTTVAQRRAWVDEYWVRSDPAFTDGAGAESFLDFLCRARSFLERLAAHPADDIAVFSHGQFINAVAWLIERKPQGIDGRAMADWREYEIQNPVPNGCGYRLSWSAGETVWMKALPLSPRDVCEVLREVAWGRRVMTRVGRMSDSDHLDVEVGGWRMSIYSSCGELDFCQTCISPDGRRWSFDSGARYGTDPVALLSTWEHKTLGDLLKNL